MLQMRLWPMGNVGLASGEGLPLIGECRYMEAKVRQDPPRTGWPMELEDACFCNRALVRAVRCGLGLTRPSRLVLGDAGSRQGGMVAACGGMIRREPAPAV